MSPGSTPCMPRLAVALLVGVTACSDPPVPGDALGGSGSSDDGTDPSGADDGSTGEPAPPDACADPCLDLASDAGIAMCRACRCKVALDDWLPSVQELQCGNAEPIVTYHAELSDTDYVLEPTAPSAMRCANPSLLTGSCRQGSRLGHLEHGDASVYWICRDPQLDLDGRVLYHDMAVIGHNRRTGATCFWDDVDDVIHDDDAPPLDLAAASEAERARSIDWFTHGDGSTCVNCHDHDPFIYTPYLQSTQWQSVAADKGPYHLVGLDGTPQSTGVAHLVSPGAAACTSCHRLGSHETCSYFAPDALASYKIDTYEDEVHAAAEPGSPHWPLAYWMPDSTVPITTFADWEATYAQAREHVLRCCASPGVDVDDCEWAPVPTQ